MLINETSIHKKLISKFKMIHPHVCMVLSDM